MKQVIWSQRALKQLSHIDSRYRSRIVSKTAQLAAFPPVVLDVKKLQEIENHYRLRCGDYRVIFSLQSGTPVVLVIQQVKRRVSRTY